MQLSRGEPSPSPLCGRGARKTPCKAPHNSAQSPAQFRAEPRTAPHNSAKPRTAPHRPVAPSHRKSRCRAPCPASLPALRPRGASGSAAPTARPGPADTAGVATPGSARAGRGPGNGADAEVDVPTQTRATLHLTGEAEPAQGWLHRAQGGSGTSGQTQGHQQPGTFPSQGRDPAPCWALATPQAWHSKTWHRLALAQGDSAGQHQEASAGWHQDSGRQQHGDSAGQHQWVATRAVQAGGAWEGRVLEVCVKAAVALSFPMKFCLLYKY